MRRLAAAFGVVAAVSGAGCGGKAGDLIAIEVKGGFAGSRAPLKIVLASDGRGSCNARPEEAVPSRLLIDARESERDLAELAEQGATYEGGRRAGASYVARIKAGTVRWEEGAPGLPDVLARTQLLALRLDRRLCRT